MQSGEGVEVFDLQAFRGRWWLDKSAKDRDESLCCLSAADYPQPPLILKAMFFWKPFVGLLLGSLFVVSCAPFPPVDPMQPGQVPNAVALPVDGNLTPAQKKEAERLKREQIKANEEARKKREALEREKNDRVDPIVPPKRDLIKPGRKYPTAMKLAAKEGFVFNPYTNNAVDVRGIPSGTLIRDPNDGNPAHLFRVP